MTTMPSTPEFMKEKLRCFATLAMEHCWLAEQKSGGQGPLHSSCKDKRALLEQIERLSVTPKFAKAIRDLSIPGGLNSPKTLLNLAQPLVAERLKGPGKQEVKTEGVKVEEMKVEGPEVKGPAAGM